MISIGSQHFLIQSKIYENNCNKTSVLKNSRAVDKNGGFKKQNFCYEYLALWTIAIFLSHLIKPSLRRFNGLCIILQ
jgi:hypothetical protein